ncbi:SMI1/KNR4 family protein [Brevibacillus formosus]|uniref:SMI1/KNR4 family protein n=1 Tax=Brevibacillus formosus TaxID=54913 RepID=UPI003F199E1D
MNLKGFGKATDEMISSFEKHIGFSLPEDYKQFLRDYNGGTSIVRYSTFYVEELNEDIPLDVMYGLGVERPFDLIKWYDEYKDDLFANSIVIGDDPGSGKIVLITDPEFKGVYYWDHVFNFEQSSEDENTYEVSESFKIFIEGLKNP